MQKLVIAETFKRNHIWIRGLERSGTWYFVGRGGAFNSKWHSDVHVPLGECLLFKFLNLKIQISSIGNYQISINVSGDIDSYYQISISWFLIEIDPLLPNIHSMLLDTYCSHIQDPARFIIRSVGTFCPPFYNYFDNILRNRNNFMGYALCRQPAIISHYSGIADSWHCCKRILAFFAPQPIIWHASPLHCGIPETLGRLWDMTGA